MKIGLATLARRRKGRDQEQEEKNT